MKQGVSARGSDGRGVPPVAANRSTQTPPLTSLTENLQPAGAQDGRGSCPLGEVGAPRRLIPNRGPQSRGEGRMERGAATTQGYTCQPHSHFIGQTSHLAPCNFEGRDSALVPWALREQKTEKPAEPR